VATTPSVQSVVTVYLPGGREFVWLVPNSPIANWQIGETVEFKTERWVVLDRVEESPSLTLRLGRLNS
jgi:hypothetical protein